jgi:DNA polymerase/3'-5' exonuclease PolX
MSEKVRYAREIALVAARDVVRALKPVTTRMVVAGSLRRRKAEVGDVEILFVPAMGSMTPLDSLLPVDGNMAEVVISNLMKSGILSPRLNVNGGTAMGTKNKLMRHVATGVPVDLFTASENNWWNYLVCRTGGAKNNMLIATRAHEHGYKWHPYHSGFERLSDGMMSPMRSEREVFEFIGLEYLEPWERS